MLAPEHIDALLHASHADPFAVLGPHLDGERLWLRFIWPGATRVEVVDIESGEQVGELERIAYEGLFEGAFAGQPLDWAYRLRVHHDNHTFDVDDPYRFGSSLGELDLHLLGEGSHLRPWQVLGGHPWREGEIEGVRFCVWAPEATRVSVIGDFNDWDGRVHPMRLHHGVGVWELFIPGVGVGAHYKYELRSRDGALVPNKSDPYAFATELRPASASVVAPPPSPHSPVPERARHGALDAPILIYEVHLGSWRRTATNEFLDWSTLAEQLPSYVAGLGFTHIELLPCAEHPFDGSWGYQVTGMYAPTRRFGEPAEFEKFIAACHAHGLAVILDWVPAHFPNDPHGLAQFDGSALYEYADPREGLHRDWDTLIYNFGRNEVRNFLVGSALYWLECWDVDALRVDAVASMLYRDYSRPEGEWVPNALGGRENLEAMNLLQRVNEVVAHERPGAVTIAEESTTWPGVTKDVELGGLGFRYKWNMGWMHDTLGYMAKDPLFRRHHHNQLTFGITYAYSEHYVLPLSHDEVVHGKGSLINKMFGDRWQKFANLRAYFGFMWTHPGKKLLFMGGELAQFREWNHDRALDWELLDEHSPGHEDHRGVQTLVRDLNLLVREQAPLHELDCEQAGFVWITPDDHHHSVIAYRRLDRAGRQVLVVCNFTPEPRVGYRVGLAEPGRWQLRLNTDAHAYAGSGYANLDDRPIATEEIASDNLPHSLSLILPPLATVVYVPVTQSDEAAP